MAVEVVVFDLGETLVDETAMWERAADAAGVPRFTVMGVLGGLAARSRPHHEVWSLVGADPPEAAWTAAELYPDALPAIAALRAGGRRVGAVGNTPPDADAMLRPHVDFTGSSGAWGVEKPAAAFFSRVIEECGTDRDRIAYVGDRVDNDVLPALAAGLVAVHVRRGPWGLLQETPPGAIAVRTLAELESVLP
jgi:FMN phosphatase YigB (HAD superfamily)